MEKQVFNFKSAQLSEELMPYCALKVILGVESCAILLSDQLKRPMGIKVWHFDTENATFDEAEPYLRRFLSTDAWELSANPATTLALSNKNVAIVANRMFDPEQLDVHFNLQLRKPRLECRAVALPEENAHLVYGAEATAWNLARQFFPKAEVKHLTQSLLHFWRSRASETGLSVMVNFRNQQMQLGVFERKALILFNTYTFQKPSDALYFALLPYEQFKINIVETPLQVSGNILEDSDLYRLISRYIHRIAFLSVDSVPLPAESAAFPAHFWTDLMSL